MRYVNARLSIMDRDEAYRIYVCGVLKIISRNRSLPWFSDILKNDKKPTPAENQDEIIDRMKKGINSLRGGS